MKKIISILLICAMVTGCSAREHGEGSDVEEPSVLAAESTSSSSVGSSKAKEPASSVSKSSSKQEVSSSARSSSVKEETSGTDTTSKKEETSSTSSTAVSSADSVPVVEEPTWTEQATNSVLYVNKEGIYSRKNAIVGSETVKKYNLNDKVSVVAVTNTDYYKLEDGSFIHKDYLSDKETVVSKPVEAEQPVTPTDTVVSVSADAEKLLNSAVLNPMKTNESDLDVLVEEVLGQITDSSMSTCQKVTAIYDYIVKTCSYGRPETAYDTDLNYHSDFDGLISSYAYTLLANKRGVCDDYSSLFVVLTRAIGLESYVVSGQVGSKSGGTTGHVWTIVKINGEYYVFDPQIEQSNTVNGQIAYTYFCRPESSVSSMYTYGVSDAMSMCLIFSDDEIQADNARDLAIALFGNFVVDEGEKSHHIGIAYY